MRIYLHELSETEKDLHYSEKDLWICEAVRSTEESPITDTPAPKKQHYLVDFTVRSLQEVVHMKGHFEIEIGLVCSRCANPFRHKLVSSFEAMFTREKSLSYEASGNVGVAHSEPTGAEGTDLEMELLEKDYIELGDVLKEQIYLQIPVQPLCKEDCKGVCPVCGQDKNTHPCQCHRIQNTVLGNALKRFIKR